MYDKVVTGPSELVSVIVPVYNEAETIEEVLKRLEAAPFTKEIIVVDDCSTDGTGAILRRQEHVVLVRHERNRGKGAAIRTGIDVARGETVIIQDADLEYDPEEIPKIVEPILAGSADVVYGSRFLSGMPPSMPLANRAANMLLVWAVRILFGYRLSDEATCYKAFRTSLLRSMRLRCNRFEFCPEVTAKALRRGIGIVEVKLHNYRPRTCNEGKKIRWTDGFEAVFTLARFRFTK